METSIVALQRKLIVKLAFLSFVLILSFGVINFMLGNLPAGLMVLAFSAVFFLSYYWLKNGKNEFLAVNMLVGGNLLMMTTNFFINGGYQGPTVYGFCIQACVFTLILSVRPRMFWFILIILFYATLLFLDIFQIVSTTNGYDDPLSLYLDHVLVFIACGMFIFYVNAMFTGSYVKQGRKLEQTQMSLDKNLKELEKSNEIKRNLIGVMAHDLRSPIKSIGGILELYREESLDQGEISYLFKSLEQRYRDLDLTLTTTLDFVMTELNDSQKGIAEKEINPVDFTEEIIHSFEARLMEKNQHVNFDKVILTDKTSIPFERNEIEVIIRNILVNAIKFTPEGLTLDIRLHISDESLRWEITDKGPGIPQNVATELFKIKVNPGVGSGEEKGTGIGLYLCKFIANKINVSLSFTTSATDGTTFLIDKKLHIKSPSSKELVKA